MSTYPQVSAGVESSHPHRVPSCPERVPNGNVILISKGEIFKITGFIVSLSCP